MKKTIKINFDLIVECDKNDSRETLLEKAMEMMQEDGLSEYINENNAFVLPDNQALPFVIRTVYGSELINKLQDIQNEENLKPDELKDKIRAAIKSSCGELVQRRFATQKELGAYGLGTCDQDGWSNCEPGDDYDFIPDEIWNEQEKTKIDFSS